jgi:8-oxo-dGTP pyrophosphatase MutT (NUDIX family)
MVRIVPRTHDFTYFKVRWMPRYGWIIDRRTAVVVVPVAADGGLWLAKVKRTPTGEASWELPGGEVGDGETVVAAGLRELEEECGLWARGGGRALRTVVQLAPGMGRFPHRVVVARRVEPRGGRPVAQREEGIVAVKKLGRAQVTKMVQKGQIRVGATLCALGLTGWLQGSRRY